MCTDAAFTLLELAIVIIIIAVVTGSGLMIGKSALDSSSQTSTNNRLDVIEKALIAFRQTNNRLPCPADGTLTKSSANFGVEASTPGNCKDGGAGVQSDFAVGANSSRIVEGVVPVRALNLPDEFMFDGWGSKIAYAVWTPMTASRSFFSYGIQFNCGQITVKDGSGNPRTSQADYVLLSYGKNGHGAYNASGTKNSSGSQNSDEKANCHCDSNAADTGYGATYVQKDPTENSANSLDKFDDVVRYKERWQLQNYADQNNPSGGLTCPQYLAGFRADGVSANDNSGYSVAVGDVNGDGIPDLIIGAPNASPGGRLNAGSVYVVFGTAKGFPDPLPLGNLNGSNGFRMDGLVAGDQLGFSVAGGDINGDGVSDVIMGAPFASPGAVATAGSVFVVFGSRSVWSTTFDLSTLNGANGIRIDSTIATGNAGFSLASGDVNNDGYADVIIGAPNNFPKGGHIYAVFGASSFSLSEYTLNSNATTGVIFSTGAKGFRVDPATNNEQLGYSVAVGDVNGDGIADIVTGQPGYNSGAGMVSVLFGRGRVNHASQEDSDLNGMNGWHIMGKTAGDNVGTSVAVGDVNGDGIGDIVIGAPGASPGGHAGAGASYVVFGNNASKPKDFYLSDLNGINGFEIDGITAGDNTGTSVAVGDVNGDGIGDIIIGAPGVSTAAGATYVYFGSTAAATNPFSLSNIGTNGFQLNGASANDRSGWAVAAGDVNGDNKSDVIIGAKTSAHGGQATSGSTYVYFGQKQATWTNPYGLSGL